MLSQLTYLRRASRTGPSFSFITSGIYRAWTFRRTFSLCLASLITAIGVSEVVFAQSTSSLVIVKCSWQKERIRPRASSAGYASQDELIQQSQRQQQLATARNTRNIGQTAKLESQITNHEKAKVEARQTDLPRDGYRYKVTLRNEGLKTTASIDWDYLFIDPTTQQIMGRHQFTSDESIKPGKSKEITVLYLSTPIKAVNAKTFGGKAASLIEQVVIMRVQYTDGSVWQAP